MALTGKESADGSHVNLPAVWLHHTFSVFLTLQGSAPQQEFYRINHPVWDI